MGNHLCGFLSRAGVESTAYVADNSSRLQWERCFAKLREIRSYDVDWNDEGGMPPTLQVVSQAISIAKNLRINREPAPSRCHATDEGNIIMSWEDTNEYFELEIDENLCCTSRWLIVLGHVVLPSINSTVYSCDKDAILPSMKLLSDFVNEHQEFLLLALEGSS